MVVPGVPEYSNQMDTEGAKTFGRSGIYRTSGNLLIENEEPQDERLVWMYNEIYNLNEIDRSLALLMLDGFNYKEMAEILKIPLGTVKSRLHAAIKTFSQIFKDSQNRKG